MHCEGEMPGAIAMRSHESVAGMMLVCLLGQLATGAGLFERNAWVTVYPLSFFPCALLSAPLARKAEHAFNIMFSNNVVFQPQSDNPVEEQELAQV